MNMDEVKQQMEFYEQIINSVQQSIIVTDKHAVIILWNDFSESLYGYSKEEAIGKKTTELFSNNASINEYLKGIEQISNGNLLVSELIVKNKAGRIFPISINLSPVYNSNNEIIGIAGTSTDISEKKKAEEQIMESEAKFRTLFESCPDGIVLGSLTGDIIDINQAHLNQLGITKDELKTLTYKHFTPNKWYQQERENIAYVKTTNKPLYSEKEFIKKDGTIFPASITGWCMKDSHGQPKYLGIFVKDITEQKKIEQELILAKEKAEENEREFRLITENTSDGILVLNADTTIRYVSPSYKKMHGISLDGEHIGDSKFIYSNIHPEDREPLFALIFKALNDKKDELIYTYRALHYEGHYYWREDHAKFNFDATGKHIDTYVICRDITDRKNIEIDLKNSLSQFNAIFNNGYVSYLIIDHSKNIVGFNEIAQELAKLVFNKPLQVGQTIYDFVIERDHADFDIDFQSAMQGNVTLAEKSFELPSGILTCFLFEYVPIANHLGKIDKVCMITHNISDWKNAQVKASKNEQMYRLLAENSSDVISLMDLDFNIKYISPSAEKMFGFSASEREFVKLNQLVSEKTYQQLKLLSQQNIETFTKNGTNEPVHFEFEAFHKNGSILTVDNLLKFIIGENNKITGIQGTSRDITEKIKAGHTIRKLQKAVESSKTSIIITDIEGNIEYANPFFCESTGYEMDEVLGKNPNFLKSDLYDNVYYEKLWNTIKNGKSWEGEFCNKKKNNELFWEKSIISPIKNTHDEITNFVAVKTDITITKAITEELIHANEVAEKSKYILLEKNKEYEALNEELRQTNDELVSAKEKAEESDRLKTHFLRNMSHEVRTPLNGIIGFSDLMVRTDKPEKLHGFKHHIQKCSIQLLEIIENIIEYSQIQSGEIMINNEEFSIKHLFEELVSKFESITKKKELLFKYSSIDFDIQNLIYSDKLKLFKVLNALLDNAVKFTAVGEIEFGCKWSEINPSNLEFYIRDTGIGLDSEHQQLVFLPFRQVESGLSRQFGGNGLGLSIAKAYIERMGGTIWLKSELNKGATFFFTIAYYGANQKQNVETENVKSANDFSNATVLIVEDEESNYTYLNELLTQTQATILYAENGKSALEVCEKNTNIDLILMDIKMPVMDGITATKIIRSGNRHMTIVAQTAFSHMSEKQKFIDIGFDDFIPKPIKYDDLFSILQRYLGKK